MMVVLVMGSVYNIVSQLDAVQAKLAQLQTTDAALALAKEALIAYALTYRDNPAHADEVFGYLPCPDTSGKGGLYLPGDGTAAGSCGTAGAIAIGLLPYVTLDLPPLRDASGNCLWYAVSGSFKNSPKASMPLNWDTQGQFGALDAQGVRLAAPDDAHGGAAAIVFAPGVALIDQQRTATDRPCRADPAQAAAYLESMAPDFVHGDSRDAGGKLANNDRLTWITPRDIFSRLVARADFRNPLDGMPAGQIARLIEAQRKALDGRLWASMSAFTAAGSGTPDNAAWPKNHADYNQFAGKRIGDLPDLKPLAYGGRDYDADFDNWQDQFRYVVCDDLKPIAGCMVFGAQNCRGALFFGGQSAGGGPRPSSARPHAPPPSRSSWLGHYFEAGGALDLLDGPALAFGGPAQYADSERSADVGICLSPGGYASFAKDIAAYRPLATSAAQPEAAVDVVDRTVTLGNPAATAAGSGCVWLPLQLPFNSSLRAYFRMRIADAGAGYVFAVVDASRNAPAMHAGTLCGSSTAAHLGYSGADVAAPKFGLEIDTRTQATGNCNGSNRDDPDANHMAFVYWGAATAATDDNCHAAGTGGSGAEPLNPRSLGTGAGIKTVQASDLHLPYAGTFPLDTDIHVRVEADKAFDGTPVRSAAWSPERGVIDLATVTAHGLTDGQRVTLAGVNPPAYDGTFTIAVSDATHFSYTPTADPGAYVAGGRVGAPPGVAVQSASWTADTVNVTTAAAHGFVSGQPVSLRGTAPSTYDGTHTVTVTGPDRFHFVRADDPGDYVAGGTLTPAVALTLRAYVASRLPVASASYTSTCSAAQLRDLSVNLADICVHRPSLVQNNVAMDVDAVTGQALAAVYAGFTNAQSTQAAGLQRVTIFDFLLKTQ
jgi:hypothetical protein